EDVRRARAARVALLRRVLVEPVLHRLKNVLVLPSGDPSFLAGGAVAFYGAVLTGIGPVAAQDQSIFLVRVTVGELLTGRTDVNVLLRHVAEVLLAKTSFSFRIRRHRL